MTREELSEELKRQALEFSQRAMVKRTEAINLAKAHQDELRTAILAEAQARRARDAARARAEKARGEQAAVEEEARRAEEVLAQARESVAENLKQLARAEGEFERSNEQLTALASRAAPGPAQEAADGIAAQEAALVQLHVRRDKLATERDALAQAVEKAENEIAQARARNAEIEAEAQRAAAQAREAQEKLAQARAALSQAQGEFEALPAAKAAAPAGSMGVTQSLQVLAANYTPEELSLIHI